MVVPPDKISFTESLEKDLTFPPCRAWVGVTAVKAGKCAGKALGCVVAVPISDVDDLVVRAHQVFGGQGPAGASGCSRPA